MPDKSAPQSYVPVAQGIERLPSKQRVAGSNPAWGTTKICKAVESISSSLVFGPTNVDMNEAPTTKIEGFFFGP